MVWVSNHFDKPPVDYKKHCMVLFDIFGQVFQLNNLTNSEKDDNIKDICLDPIGNLQGMCKLSALEMY